nr:hypothetical protein [Tanacetum cinerariifolium]
MAQLTFYDMHNMVAFLSKSDASACFDQIVDFLNAQVIRVVVSEDVIRQDLRLDDAGGVECLPNEDIFTELVLQRGLRARNSIVQWRLLSSALLQTPLFASMPVQPQAEVEEDDAEVPATPTPPSSTITPTPPLQYPITTPPQAQPAPPSSPPQEQQTDTSESYIIGNTQAQEEGQKVRKEEEIKVFWFKEGRKDDDNAAIKDVSATEPTVFDNEVTMTMALTLIKMKAKKARLLDEQIAKRLYDEEVKQVAAREKQEKDDLERAKVLQQQYDDKQENIDWNAVAEQMQEKPIAEIHSEGSRSYWKIIRVGGIIKTYQSFEDVLKSFNREDLDSLWRLVKEEFSSAVPNVEKEKALWVELK